MFFFKFSPHHNTRGHKYKLPKRQSTACVRANFFNERVLNIWNSLPDDVVNFDSFYQFKRSIKGVNMPHYFRFCYWFFVILICVFVFIHCNFIWAIVACPVLCCDVRRIYLLS